MNVLIGGFTRHLRDEDELAPRTIEQYRARLQVVERFVDKPIHLVTSDDLRSVKLERDRWSSGYRKNLVVATRRFHSWGALEGHWPLNGIMLVKPPREENDSARPLPLHKARALLGEATTSLEIRCVYLGELAGLRVAESSALNESDWEDGWLYVHGKGAKNREIPVHPLLEAVRDRILDHPHPHRESVRKAGVRVAARLGWHLKTHQCRKTFSTALYDCDENDGRTVEYLLGHGDVSSRYILVPRRRKKRAIWTLPF